MLTHRMRVGLGHFAGIAHKTFLVSGGVSSAIRQRVEDSEQAHVRTIPLPDEVCRIESLGHLLDYPLVTQSRLAVTLAI